jgi:hypothetical protein
LSLGLGLGLGLGNEFGFEFGFGFGFGYGTKTNGIIKFLAYAYLSLRDFPRVLASRI